MKKFYPVPLDALEILPLINTHAKDLYLCLCFHANWKTGICWPSYRKILDMTKIHNGRDIKEAIDHLVELGMIDTWMVGQRRHYQVL